MEIEILVSKDCRSCAKAVAQWKQLCEERDIPLRVCDAEGERGRALVVRFDLKVLPALLVDGELKAVGVQTREQAQMLLGFRDEGAG